MSNIESKIRNLKIPQLEILKILVANDNGISSSKEMGDTTHTATTTLGAMITPLRRIKNEKGCLIEPVGREIDNSVRWKINEKLISRDSLKMLLAEMEI